MRKRESARVLNDKKRSREKKRSEKKRASMIFHKDGKERSRIILTGRKNGHEIMPERKQKKN
jgi:hypothetical protein